MVTYDELAALSNKSQGNSDLSEEDLITFVKGATIRPYKKAHLTAISETDKAVDRL